MASLLLITSPLPADRYHTAGSDAEGGGDIQSGIAVEVSVFNAQHGLVDAGIMPTLFSAQHIITMGVKIRPRQRGEHYGVFFAH